MQNDLEKLTVKVNGDDIINIGHKILGCMSDCVDNDGYTNDQVIAVAIYAIGSILAKRGVVIDQNKSLIDSLPTLIAGYESAKQSGAH